MKDGLETSRLLIRRWHTGDASLLLDAIAGSTDELRRFTPWVIPEAPELHTLVTRIEAIRKQFDGDESWIYGIFDRAGTRVIGQIGLYARVGPGALELGYFIRSDAARRGYATEAANALIDVAFSETDVARVEIRCDAHNEASVAIARRLGFSLRDVLHEESGTELMIWDLLRESWTASRQRLQTSARTVDSTGG